ncbi:MAG TPA: universal stress protein [Myxococcota bacterium]|nr:universal stress protein [Myxococcota bacterium]
MYRFERLLVVLDLSDRDEALLRYAGMLTRLTGAREVHFLHAQERMEIPEEIVKKYLEFKVSEPSARKEQMEEAVRRYFNGADSVRTFFETREGVPSDELLAYIMEQEVDLVVIGKEVGDQQSLKLTERLARKAPCSVLCVPPQEAPMPSRLLVAVDFSDYSRDALDTAVALAKAIRLGEILCLHVFQVPLRYTKTGHLYGEYEAITHRNVEEMSAEFIKQIDLQGISVETSIMQGDFPSETIRDFIEKEGVDLLIVGARGRSAGAAILLGSVTEHLIRITDCPLLAVKRKGEGLGFLKALF